MPAGVPWGPYLRAMTAALVSMFAGSQAVHMYYRPLDDLEKMVKEELKKYGQQEDYTTEINKVIESFKKGNKPPTIGGS